MAPATGAEPGCVVTAVLSPAGSRLLFPAQLGRDCCFKPSWVATAGCTRCSDVPSGAKSKQKVYYDARKSRTLCNRRSASGRQTFLADDVRGKGGQRGLRGRQWISLGLGSAGACRVLQ